MTAAPPAQIANGQLLPNGHPMVWPPAGQAQQPEQDGLNLINLWRIVRRRSLWFGISFGLVFTTVGVLTVSEWLLKPQYRGGFRMLVSDPLAEDRTRDSSELAALARVNTSVNVPTLVDVLTSPMLLEPLAKQLGLPSGSLLGKVAISQSGAQSGVLNVNLIWDNPEKGTTVIQALANEYLAYSLRQRKEKLSQGVQFLDEQAPGLQQRVLQLQQELATFRRANTMLAPEEESRSLEASRAGLEAQLRSLTQTEAQLKGLLVMVQSGQLVSPFQGTSTPVSGETNPGAAIKSSFSSLLSELVAVEGELAKVEATFRNETPLVRTLRARRDNLRPLLQQREQDAILSALKVNRVQQQKVQAQFESLGAEFRRNPELIKNYEALQQRLSVARENLGSYLKARETFRLEIAQSTVPWQVISPPQFAVIPVEPNLRNRLFQGLFLGLAAGTAVAYLRDRLDRVFHSSREVENVLSLPLLASVPFLPFGTDKPMAQLMKELEPEEQFGLRESLRSFYQSLRTLRANRTLRVVAITSSAAGEGKTTTTALLGQTLVDMGMKVLLVDADLRRARLHRRLGIDNVHGLSELFGESPPPLDQLFQWLNPNLAVLSGGPRLPDPARLLSSPRCAEIIEEIRNQNQFDLIIFDTAPALELVDPLLISEHMDGMILLVSLGRINRELPSQVVRKVRESGVDLLGVVTNQRIESIGGIGYGYGYGYGMGYGYGSSYAPKTEKPETLVLGKASKALRSASNWLDGTKPAPESLEKRD